MIDLLLFGGIGVFVPTVLILGTRIARMREAKGKDGRNLGAVFVILAPAALFFLVLFLASR